MHVPGLLRKALRDLVRRPLRSSLTILGIAVGVAGLVAIVSLGQNIAQAQAETYANTSQADLDYWVWNASPGVLRALESVPNVDRAELRASYHTKWRVGTSWRDIELIGIPDFGTITLNQFAIVAGRVPRPGEALIEVSARDIAPLELEQEIVYRDGQDLRERTLTISGFSRSPSYLSSVLTSITRAYVPASEVRRQLGIEGYNQLLVRLHDVRQAQETVSRINRLLERRGIWHGAPLIRDPQSFPGKRELDGLLVLLTVFSTVGLGVSSFLVINTLLALLAEQVREVGIIKAIGGSRGQIVQLYLYTTAIYGLAGTLVGLLLGALVGWWLLRLVAALGNVEVPFRLAPRGVALGTVVGVGVTLLAGLIPAWVGARTPVRLALQGYGIAPAFGRGWLEESLRRLAHLPPTLAMAARNLARRKGRSLVTISVIALAAASFLATQATRASVNRTIDEAFVTYGADVWVWFSEAVGKDLAQQIESVPGVHSAEAWTLTDCWVEGIPARLWGVPADTRLYRPRLQEGRWFASEETDSIVVSSELAAAQDVRLGDRLELEVAGRQREVEVVGIAIDNSILLGSTLAGKVFAPRDVVARLLGRQGVADFFAVALLNGSPAYVDRTIAEIEREFRPLRPGAQPTYTDVESARKASQLLTLALALMVLLVGLVGAIGVVNTLGLSVLERRREIGVLRAIGATNRPLVVAFVGEGVAMAMPGWLLGLILGYPLGRLFTRLMEGVLFRIDYVFSPSLIGTSLAFALALAAAASVGPALAAARMPAQEALRHE
ncbi:MAG: FtsX-like permease family protein [Anaerolineae bacterium]|nr:FtsX-like permease family protein [Anaerolineae bacterium]